MTTTTTTTTALIASLLFLILAASAPCNSRSVNATTNATNATNATTTANATSATSATNATNATTTANTTSPFVAGDLIAVGDVHGCLDCLLDTLEANGVVDADGNWIAGNRTVVQVGDLLDRGPDDREVIQHIRRLSAEAEAAGGKWVQLLGNHEDMNLNGDFRYANDGPDAGFGTTRARAGALAPGGSEGDWLRSLPVMHQWEGVVFVHGGLSNPQLAQFGVDAINRYARMPEHRSQIVSHILWDRTLTLQPEEDVCPLLDEVLGALGAHTMVVGHTITASAGFAPGELAERCGGKLRMTDVGMSDAYDTIPKFNRAAHFFSSAQSPSSVSAAAVV